MEEKRGGWSPSIFAVIVAFWVIGFGYTFCMQQSHLNEVEEDRAVAISRLEEARNRNAALKEGQTIKIPKLELKKKRKKSNN